MGSSHDDRVGGFTKVHTATPTVSASPDYTAVDAMGGLITLTNFGRRHRILTEEPLCTHHVFFLCAVKLTL